ncbi:NADH-quinone oxidoreductase subunit G [Eubacterium aggregans]|uniref:NADH-quinone oxidoreductase subunit G n=1 Tax=Eubacterium aggregans TaxID=81409 RepID=A0A1H4BHI1_9FIRM|nr:[FeFe] hydrogenase, group A [Eubacterium aggregans]SEA47590.1 NADH-quinone oxidoreductase subunit G [Eubacterium aggregans]
MVKVTINNKQIEVAQHTTIMEACEKAGWPVPSLCYLKDINEIGACRICVVEIKGVERLVTACNNEVCEGMVVSTNSPKVREARRTNLSLILSQHDGHCPTCARNGNCTLQNISYDLGIEDSLYKKDVPENNWPQDFPLIRNESKCIKCMRCIQICDKVQGLGIWDIAKSGSRTTVDVSGGRKITEADCAVCGQCVTHCPVGALRGRDDKPQVFAWNQAVSNPDVVAVVQVAPSVRAAWGEALGIPRDKATPGRLAAALRLCGFDYVFDTNFGADLTIMEEGSEFLARIGSGEAHRYPMFTSCCPGWVRFLKSQYPDMVEDLSTAKSPQQMQGAVIKSAFAQKVGIDPKKIFSVSIMPCLAKKTECDIPSINDGDGDKDVDLVLTTRELVRQLRSLNINVADLPEESFDSPLDSGTGAAVIFGATGGVMEAALRSCYFLATGENPGPDDFKAVRGNRGWREATFDVKGTLVRTAVVSGLGNARELIRALRRGEVAYDFVEVMACPGGCVGGGGQPIHDGLELAEVRSRNLYNLDKMAARRFSHENPEVLTLYEEYLGEPLSHKAHHLLHTDHHAWNLPMTPHPDPDVLL